MGLQRCWHWDAVSGFSSKRRRCRGAVLRASGSARMLSVGMSGICSLTMLMYFSLVTTHIFSTGQIGFNLSTVSCMSERPTPITSINCLGYSGVDIGHKRLPTPPAIMITCMLLKLFIVFFLLLSLYLQHLLYYIL